MCPVRNVTYVSGRSYYGRNNGDLSLSLDEAAEGNFIRGHATTYRLTFRKACTGQLPTDEWKGWIKPPRATKSRKPWSNWKAKAREPNRQVAAEKTLSGTENEPIA